MTSSRQLCAQRVASALSVAAVAFGIAVSPLSSGPARADDACASAGTFSCLRITSAAPGTSGSALGVSDRADDSSSVQLVPANQPSTSWQFTVNQDSTLQIRNVDTGGCIDVSATSSDLEQGECAGQSSQEWYVEPLAAGSTTYQIRQADTGECMTLVQPPAESHLLPIRPPRAVEIDECGTDATQEWNIGAALALGQVAGRGA